MSSLIINADDWGRDSETTGRTLDCLRRKTVSSVSAMVFMRDSERAAEIAREQGIDAGLHLNVTTPLLATDCPRRLCELQGEIGAYLRRFRLARMLFHPGLVRSFEYVVRAQMDEFHRLYGMEPQRLDGHHHMQLCANVHFGQLLPAGTFVRRNFSFERSEKGFINRSYRRWVDGRLSRRHRLTDYLFSLTPLAPERLQRIFALAREHVVEVETHPVNPEEYCFLTRGEIFRLTGDLPIARGFTREPAMLAYQSSD